MPLVIAASVSSHFKLMSIVRDASLNSATIAKYRSAALRFLQFCTASIPTSSTATSLLSPDSRTQHDDVFSHLTAADIDVLMSDFIDSLYAEGGSFDLAKNAVFGTIHFQPLLKQQLPESRLRLQGWTRSHPAHQRPPLTWSIACLLAVSMAKSGYPFHAVATLLAFDCYLRIGEFTSLLVRDIAVPNDPRMGPAYTGMAVILKVTKTGRNQSVTIRRPEVCQLLLSLLRVHRSPYSTVFNSTAATYRSVFHSACAAVGLGHVGYSPHSLRHGGATEDFLKQVPLADILFRGRWAASKSATTYVQSGRALLLTASIPMQVAQLSSHVSTNVFSLLKPLIDTHQPQASHPRAPARAQ